MLKLLPLLLFLVIPPSFAEVYRWVDSNGRVQYSDQPPPDVDAKKVSARPATGSEAAPAKSYSEKDQEFRKRQLEGDEKAKKQAALDDKAKAEQQNCAQARNRLATLQAGGRISRTTDKGEREYLDDQAIASERVTAEQAVAQWCK